MDITRDIAQLQDPEIRARLERDAPRTVDAAFSALAQLLLMRFGPVTIGDKRLTIIVADTPIAIAVGDHCATLSFITDAGHTTSARVRSLPDLERLFDDAVTAAKRVHGLATA
jgi:hypothetical protein